MPTTTVQFPAEVLAHVTGVSDDLVHWDDVSVRITLHEDGEYDVRATDPAEVGQFWSGIVPVGAPIVMAMTAVAEITAEGAIITVDEVQA